MLFSLESRLQLWIANLESCQACTSQSEAHALIIAQWEKANEAMGAPRSLLLRIREQRLCAEHGWIDIGKEVCYWDLIKDTYVRIYLHQHGQIVVQRLESERNEILFTSLKHDAPRLIEVV